MGIPKQVVKSEAYNMLSGWSVRLLVDIAKQYNGFNNGDLQAVFSILSKWGWNSKGTLDRAKKQLLDSGFIVQTRQGGKHRCSLYAITWYHIDECKGKLDVKPTKVASNDWKKIKSSTPYEYQCAPYEGQLPSEKTQKPP
jgi:hypothetical protein